MIDKNNYIKGFILGLNCLSNYNSTEIILDDFMKTKVATNNIYSNWLEVSNNFRKTCLEFEKKNNFLYNKGKK